jgi:hypothetical protein
MYDFMVEDCLDCLVQVAGLAARGSVPEPTGGTPMASTFTDTCM